MRTTNRLLILPISVLAMCLAAACERAAPGRVIVLGLDGLDPRAVDLLMSEGKLPNFARMRQEGAYGRLLSSRPLSSPVLWTTIATGRPPADHGIVPFVAENRRSEIFPVTSEARRVKTIWNVLSDLGKKVAVVGWWTSWPAEEVNGAIVSDHTCYHFLSPQIASGESDRSRVTHPRDLLERVEPLVACRGEVSSADLSPFMRVSEEEASRELDFGDDVSHFKWALATARSYERIGLRLWQDESPELLMVHIEAPDTASHLFGHLFRAGELEGELAEQKEKFGDAVEQMYLHVDRLVGRYLDAMDDDTTLVVLSDHGFELGLPQEDSSMTPDLRRVNEELHSSEGVLYLYGNRVKHNARIVQATILDVAPTILELAAEPAARDMPGGVLAEALLGYEPRELVATYEPIRTERSRRTGDRGADGNLAALHFEAGRYEEAVRVYRELIEAEPSDVSLRASLAGALGAMGRFDEALEQIEISLSLAPLNVEAYHNRAVIHEKRGNPEAAVADYRAALLYEPDYEPSMRALLRLTGSAEPRVPRSENERRAWAVAAEAAEAARRGDYPRAMTLLDRAEAISPHNVVVYQFRSNVAYLMGDVETAAEALEKALELEPENALFQTNLKRLQERARP